VLGNVVQQRHLLVLGERPPDAVPAGLHAASDRVLGSAGGLAGVATLRSASRVLVGVVSGAAATDVVDWCLMLHHLALAVEFLVEAEDGALLLVVHVACTTTAGCIVGVGVGGAGDSELGARGRAGSISACGELAGVDVGDVASTTSARVDVVAGRDRWVRLSDAVARGDHFEELCMGVVFSCGCR